MLTNRTSKDTLARRLMENPGMKEVELEVSIPVARCAFVVALIVLHIFYVPKL